MSISGLRMKGSEKFKRNLLEREAESFSEYLEVKMEEFQLSDDDRQRLKNKVFHEVEDL